LTSFLQNPDKGFLSIDTPQFFINLSPNEEGKANGLQRKRAYSLTRQEIFQYIEENVPKGQEDKFSFTLSEFFENELGGNIVVNPDGSFIFEAVNGAHLPLALGTKTPEYTIERDEFTQAFHVKVKNKDDDGRVKEEKLKDDEIANALLDALHTIPHTGEGRNLQFTTPGYYEFACIRRGKDKPLEPIFLEYQDNPAYYIPSEVT